MEYGNGLCCKLTLKESASSHELHECVCVCVCLSKCSSVMDTFQHNDRKCGEEFAESAHTPNVPY